MIFNFILYGSESEIVKFERQLMKILLRIFEKNELLANEIHFCIHEAILNIIQHAYHWDNSKTIEVSVNFKDLENQKEIEIIITDYAPSIKQEISPPESIETFQMRKRGLYMINQIMDEFSITPAQKKGNITRMKKYFSPLSQNHNEDKHNESKN